MTVYIYGLRCPVENTIRYVGKSVDPRRRLRGHICAASRGATDHHTARWLRRILDAGFKPEIIVLREVADGERWQEVEREVIASAETNGWRLTNTTAGGEGLDYRDEDAKASYAETQRRATLTSHRENPHLVAALIAEAMRVAKDPDIVARRSESIRLSYKREDVRAKNAAARADIAARPEVKAAKSAATAAAWQRQEYREAIIAARNDPTFVAEQGARLKSRWVDPEAREKMMQSRWSPEKRAAQAEVIRQRSTPEYRAMMAEKTRAAWAKRKGTR